MDDHWGHYVRTRLELYKVITEEAHKQNMRVMAHSVRDREVDDALIKTLKEKNSFAVAMLTREESTFTYAEPPAAQALKIATLNTAECFHVEKDFGTLDKGKRADLIVLDADPLENILNTRKINQVWIGGREVRN